MNDKPASAKNPALKVQSAQEKVMFGKDAKNEPQRAIIFMPGIDNAYTEAEKGGITTRQTPSKAPAKRTPTTKVVKKVKKKPVKKPTKKAAVKALSPARRSEALAKSVVSDFSDRLIKEAKTRGGYLSVSDLELLNKDFQKKASELEVAFEKSFEEYIQDHERKSWVNSRRRPFDRMLVKTFSHLLEDDSRKIKRSKYVSRRMLPGFFVALNLMLGTDVRNDYQGKCRAITKLATQQNGKEFDWDDIYENEDARAIAFDALVEIASNFSDLKKRREWFVDLVNSNLNATSAEADEDIKNWTMSAQGFDEFFDALMSELRIAVSMEAGRSLITRRHSAETTEKLVALMKKLAPSARST